MRKTMNKHKLAKSESIQHEVLNNPPLFCHYQINNLKSHGKASFHGSNSKVSGGKKACK